LQEEKVKKENFVMHRCCYSCCFNDEFEPESHPAEEETKIRISSSSVAVNILESYLAGTSDITTNV
jgi:hypothetical protein